MAATDPHLDQSSLITKLLEGEHDGQCPVKQHFSALLDSPSELLKLPSLNDADPSKLQHGSVVRFRCMIQDNSLDQEIYQKDRRVANTDGSIRHVSSKYSDSPSLKEGETFVDDMSEYPPSNALAERQSYYCVSVPGENEWVRDGWNETRLSNVSRGNSKLRSRKYPLGQAPHASAVALVYDERALKFNEVVEFVGVISLPVVGEEDSEVVTNAEESDTAGWDAWGIQLPNVPRLHVILMKPVAYLGNPYLNANVDIENTIAHLNVPLLREKVLERLTYACNGDSLAAELALLAIISRAHHRESTRIGSMNLRLVSPDGLPRLQPLLEELLPRLHRISLTLSELNTKVYLPQMSERNGLLAGELQLAEGTILLVDETKLEAGQVRGRGVLNMHGLKQVKDFGKVPVGIRPSSQDTDGAEVNEGWMDQEVDLPIIVVGSTNTGILSADVVVPIVPERVSDELSSGLKRLAIQGDDLLRQLRCYLSIVRQGEIALSEEVSQFIENDFVTSRARAAQHHQRLPGQTDLFHWVGAAKLLSLSLGKSELTRETYLRMKSLEQARLLRF